MAAQILKKFYILNVGISAIDINDASSLVDETILKKQKKYICVCPVSTIMACKRDRKAMESVNCADLATPDGMPTVWIGRIYGHRNVRRVYGPELMDGICGISAKKGYRNYFYGAGRDVLEKLNIRIRNRYPQIIVAGMYSPPFRPLTKEEDDEIVRMINESGPHILWVGLGSPKQDIWMHEHRDRIDAPVMIGVGAAFDFMAGTKLQAPPWIRNNGFEWLFRLIIEPRRLWKRYLIDNPLFVCYAVSELILNMAARKKSNINRN